MLILCPMSFIPSSLERRGEENACTQAPIRFFTAKYQILQLYSNGHSFVYSGIRNFTVVPKRPFFFFTAKYKILQLYQNGYSFFTAKYKIQNCSQMAIQFFFITKHKSLKFVPKRPFVFQNKIENFESCAQTANSYFPQGNTKSNYL